MSDSTELSGASFRIPILGGHVVETRHDGITTELIHSELDAVLATDAFRRARRSSRLLAVLIRYSLENRVHELKEYTLGVEVFDRTQAFDPRLDPIVRVEMGRLRKKLDEYYAGEGSERTIRIQLPLRHYAAVFKAQGLPGTSRKTVPASSAASPARRSLRFALALLAVLMAVGSIVLLWERRQTGAKARVPTEEASLAVLPFSDLRADSKQDLAADALTEELIEALVHVGNLRIISRLAGSYYKNRGEDVIEIGRRLRVKYILEGSVSRAGDRARVIARLIDAAEGHRLWSRTFLFPQLPAPEFEVQAAHRIVDELRQRLGMTFQHPFAEHTSAKPEAYFRFLKGARLSEGFAAGDLRKALQFFEQAISIDPEYASAWSGLADTYTLLVDSGEMEPRDAMEKARSAANRALHLDKDMARAHASRAFVSAVYDWNWKAAAAEFRLAHDLDPGDARIHEAWVLGCLLPTAQLDEALKQIQEARVLDPLSVRIASALAMTHYFRREYNAAIAEEQKALDLDSGFFPAHLWLAQSYSAQGREHEAASEWEQWRKSAAWTAGLPKDREPLIQWLEEAARKRLPIVTQLNIDPRFDSLRSSRRFQNLIQELGLLPTASLDAGRN